MGADVTVLGSFALGTLFGVVTTIAVFRATMLLHDRRISALEGRTEGLKGYVNRIADTLAQRNIYVKRESDQ